MLSGQVATCKVKTSFELDVQQKCIDWIGTVYPRPRSWVGGENVTRLVSSARPNAGVNMKPTTGKDGRCGVSRGVGYLKLSTFMTRGMGAFVHFLELGRVPKNNIYTCMAAISSTVPVPFGGASNSRQKDDFKKNPLALQMSCSLICNQCLSAWPDQYLMAFPSAPLIFS